MKKKYTAMLASAAALAMLLTGCKGDPGSSASSAGSADPGASSSVSSGVTSDVSSGVTSADVSVQPEEPDVPGEPVNSRIFLYGADFPGMTMVRNDNYDDGTYWYEDLTEDKMTSIVNRSFPTDPSWLEPTDNPWDYVIWAAIDASAKDSWGQAPGEEGMCKGEYLPYYAHWSTGTGEDTRRSDGVMIIEPDFTYIYYLTTTADNYKNMTDTFSNILEQVQLETVME